MGTMAEDDVNEHHSAQLVSYMKFAKYQRGQCIKSVKAAVQDTKEVRLNDDTYTLDEVDEVIEAVTESVASEVETELINTAHTNILLLRQLFSQAEKWHLNLDTDTSELENRDLLEAVKKWEEREFTGGKIDTALKEKKKLAPLNEGGPTQLLQIQIQKLEQENQALKLRIKTVEGQATDILQSKLGLKMELENLQKKAMDETPLVIKEDNSMEMEKLSEQVEAARQELLAEKQLSEKSQKDMESDLISTKHRYLEVQHQLELSEKELEKKFSQTGAYKNLKKMLSSKNETIKELRRKLNQYEPNADDLKEED